MDYAGRGDVFNFQIFSLCVIYLVPLRVKRLDKVLVERSLLTEPCVFLYVHCFV